VRGFEPSVDAETERTALQMSKPRDFVVRVIGMPEPPDVDAQFARYSIAKMTERLRRP
jgi:hypothetical protein